MSTDPRLAEALNDCIERLREGAEIDECLRAWPANAQELRPLLQTAQQVWLADTMLQARPCFQAELRGRLMRAARQRQPRRRPLAPFLRALGTVAAALVVLTLLGSGAVAAASDALPGDPLYSVKRAAEAVTLAITPDSSARIAFSVELVERRLAEIEQLTVADRPVSPSAIEALADHTEHALGEVAPSSAREALDDRLARLATRQQVVLSDLAHRVPAAARPAIERAKAAARRGVERAAPHLPAPDPATATPTASARPGISPTSTEAAAPLEPPTATPAHGRATERAPGEREGDDRSSAATAQPVEAPRDDRTKPDGRRQTTTPTAAPDRDRPENEGTGAPTGTRTPTSGQPPSFPTATPEPDRGRSLQQEGRLPTPTVVPTPRPQTSPTRATPESGQRRNDGRDSILPSDGKQDDRQDGKRRPDHPRGDQP